MDCGAEKDVGTSLLSTEVDVARHYVCDMQLLFPLFPQNNTEDQSQLSWGGLNPVQFGELL